jgi:glycosyltransferase involved in cell wall biosynthesis
MKEELKSWGVSKTRVIANPVDLAKFAPRAGNAQLRRDLTIANTNTVVFHASNLKRCKRSVDIVNSAKQALQVAPTLVYVIAGDGPLRAEMEQVCREHRLCKNFRFTGWLQYDRMPDYFAAADLVVMTSSTEQQARVYLEAQACGRTLLSSDVPGAREVVQDGETGILFRMGDVADLTRKTLTASADHQLRERIGIRARQAVQRHEIARVAEEWVSYLKETSRASTMRLN